MNKIFIFLQMGLVLILTVVPTLQTARYGVDETIANVLAGFQIILSPDKHEVMRLVIYYIWCVEGEGNHRPHAWHKYHQHFCALLLISVNENSLNMPMFLQCATPQQWLCRVWSTWFCSCAPWFSIGKSENTTEHFYYPLLRFMPASVSVNKISHEPYSKFYWNAQKLITGCTIFFEL